jgi:hypothetical protein
LAKGWVLESGPPGPWHNYRHPEKPSVITINSGWTDITAGDATFQILARLKGVTAKDLIRLLQGH